MGAEQAVILGIGQDLLDIERIAKIISEPSGPRFLAKVLTAGERAMAAEYEGLRLQEFVAGRFAAKEAVVKAFGCGIGQQLGFQDIEVLRGSQGKPQCRLSPASWGRLGLNPQQINIHLTITHERKLASAFVVVEQLGG
jgi:holo-[acyl-carrier protein] synthase